MKKIVLLTLLALITALPLAAQNTDAPSFDNGGTRAPRSEKKKSNDRHVIRNKKGYDCTKKTARALHLYERRRYTEASTLFDDVRMNCGGYTGIDTVLFYSGMSKLKTKQAEQAVFDFRDVTNNHQGSAFADEAAFRIAQCAYVQSPMYEKDQAKTREALSEIADYLEIAPVGPFADSARVWTALCTRKLITKDIMAARFYEKIRKWESAVVYYQSILELYPADSTNAECRLALGRDLVRINRYSEAVTTLKDLLASNPDEATAKKARNILARLEKNGAIPGTTSDDILDETPDH